MTAIRRRDQGNCAINLEVDAESSNVLETRRREPQESTPWYPKHTGSGSHGLRCSKCAPKPGVDTNIGPVAVLLSVRCGAVGKLFTMVNFSTLETDLIQEIATKDTFGHQLLEFERASGTVRQVTQATGWKFGQDLSIHHQLIAKIRTARWALSWKGPYAAVTKLYSASDQLVGKGGRLRHMEQKISEE